MKYKIVCKHCGRVIKDPQNLNHICKGTMRKSGHKVHIELDLSLGNKNDKKIFKLFSSNEVILLTAEDIAKINEKMNESAKKMIKDASKKIEGINNWGTQFPINEFPANPYPGFPDISPADLEKRNTPPNIVTTIPGGTSLNPCEGCSNYERIKRGESVVCHCTIPYFKKPIIS